MTLNDSFPLGQPGFVSHPIDRAAHLRTNDEKLYAMETHRDARAYVIHRDSLLMTQGADGPRALLTLDEARKFGANPGTIFLGLRDGAAIFGMGISATAAEALMGRSDVGVENLRAVAASGAVAPRELSTIAMAKSLVGWHQRHGFCANCGTRTSMNQGGWKRRLPKLQGRTFSAHGSRRHHAGHIRRQVPAWASVAISTVHVVMPCRLRRSCGNHRGCCSPRDFGRVQHPVYGCALLHDAAVALSVVADDRVHRSRHHN